MEEKKEINVEGMTICPCCGRLTFPTNTELSQDLVDEYMACVLSEEPFRHTYRLFNNKVAITCGQPSAADMREFSKLGVKISKLQDQNLRTEADILLYRLTSLYAVKCITIQANGGRKVYQVEAVCRQVLNDLLQSNITPQKIKQSLDKLDNPQNVSATPLSVLTKVIDTHTNVSRLLLTVGFDSDFYKGIPHVQ